MLDRRGFLGRSLMTPVIVAIPWTLVPDNTIKQVPNRSKEILKRFLNYVDYTEEDWMNCGFVIFNDKGRKLWAPPITQVELVSEPFSVIISAIHKGARPNLKITSCQFYDLGGKSLFGRNHFDSGPILTTGGESVKFTQRISM